MSRPSDDMTLEELREKYDWIYEFQSRMAERISGNPDVHNHVDYVNQLEVENAKLRELVSIMAYCMQYERECNGCRMNGADGIITAFIGCDGLRNRMRELRGWTNE